MPDRPARRRAVSEIQFQTPKMPHRAVHPLIRFIWEEMARQQVSQEIVAERSGVSSSAMRHWRDGTRTPNVIALEAILNTLGFAIDLKPLEDER